VDGRQLLWEISMRYIDGYLIPVTAGNKEAYRDMATKATSRSTQLAALP